MESVSIVHLSILLVIDFWVMPTSWHSINSIVHDDVIKWKHFPHYWPFARGIHRSPVNSPHKGQWRGALMFSLICAWINAWVNNCEAGDLRRHRAHYGVIVMFFGHVGLGGNTLSICPLCGGRRDSTHKGKLMWGFWCFVLLLFNKVLNDLNAMTAISHNCNVLSSMLQSNEVWLDVIRSQ